MRKPSWKHKRTFVQILSDDFAAVDLREESCNNSLSEKEKRGGGRKYRTKRRAAEEQGDFASGSAQNALSAAACFVALISAVKFFGGLFGQLE